MLASKQLLYLSLALATASNAFELSSFLPFLKTTHEDAVRQVSDTATHRVAIIGAGAAGSSAAFWIAKAKKRSGLEIDVDVYEQSGYIGGRSTVVYPYNNTKLPPVELGASIFVQANKNLWRASQEFNLTRYNFDDDNDETGIWDGEKFVLTIGGGKSTWSNWLDNLKLLWRYGWSSPQKTQKLVQSMLNRFLTLYTPESPKWDTISNLTLALEWQELLMRTAAEYFDVHGVSRRFSREIIEAATRVNYGQNVDRIHALEAACSMAANGASRVAGGNFQMFEHFLKKSGAHVHLNTAVKTLEYADGLWYLTTSASIRPTAYSSVVLAAPFHSTGIALSPASLASAIPEQPYVHLHVTLLATAAPAPNPAYFGLRADARVPTTVLTTHEGVRRGGAAREPEFNSLTYHGLVDEGAPEGEREWVVKIFSRERLSDEWLQVMFSGRVGWVYRKEWDAYPELPPTMKFPPVKLERGLYYVNAFEPFISTMETETISARNVVDLLFRDEFNAGVCPPPVVEQVEGEQEVLEIEKVRTSRGDDFVLGWDC
ncbi:FAD/NAD P-binding domain-containing protein [Gloeophyllum trabeum ATCC 11539]|uniref:FAD/NAD P-binding domain-containing protein n=1 Tax=Gloeophyllum trabeum (strain ATCC 11539 / FP-39264 / Madison 617) TaxID=670483 RepID=S7S0Y8_GLOTA|nr:FAD/NAD P-binding domain-containing protein [Gloeophyllum trabeum ATCC 11539]EPQ61030.1 FAD/NAD P-binding domain-containing protein [Gloeophyllum trabeum ATCC 11539]